MASSTTALYVATVAKKISVSAVLRLLGRNVRAARVTAGLTQEAAAARARIDYKRWQRIEQGSVNVTVRTLVRIATVLNASFWDLHRPHIGHE